MKNRYLLNIKTGKIHSATHPCKRVKTMIEANKKYFDDYESAVNYFEGQAKRGEPCGICLKDKQ